MTDFIYHRLRKRVEKASRTALGVGSHVNPMSGSKAKAFDVLDIRHLPIKGDRVIAVTRGFMIGFSAVGGDDGIG